MSIVSVSTQVFKPTAVLMPSRRLWELLYLMKKSQSFQLIIILNLKICDVHMHRNIQHMSVCEESCLKASRGCFCCKTNFFSHVFYDNNWFSFISPGDGSGVWADTQVCSAPQSAFQVQPQPPCQDLPLLGPASPAGILLMSVSFLS